MSSLLELLSSALDDPLSPGGRHLGVEVGQVSDNQDPEGLGRVRVIFPRLPDSPESDWLRVAIPAASHLSGFFWLPAVDDEVLLAFERGDPSSGYVIGCLWNGRNPPPSPEPASDPGSLSRDGEELQSFSHEHHEIRSRAGHRLVLEDREGGEKLSFHDSSGNLSLTLDTATQVLSLESLHGDLELRAPKGSIRLKGQSLEVETQGSAEVKSGGELRLKAKGSAEVRAGPVISLKGRRINLN